MTERSDLGERRTGLSDLQARILKHYADGKSSAQVARAVAVSEATMRRNLKEARDLLNAANTANAIYIAAKAGLI